MGTTDHLAKHLDKHFARIHESPITTEVTVNEVRSRLASRYTFEQPLPLEEVIDDVGSMLWHWSEHSSNPAHFGLFRPNVDLSSVAADALVAAYNPNLATYDFSPAAHEIENHVLELLADHFGLTATDRMANYTSGGQEANHSAVAVALTHQFPTITDAGLRTLKAQPVFYLSQEGHHSFEKVAHSTGLGRDSIRWVPATAELKMDLASLEALIRRDWAKGLLPFMIVGTAGTTNAGVIDPLPELAAIADRQNLWFHVDAAWAGAAVLSNRLRPALNGIERADSITCDAHKWLSVPTGAGIFFCRHKQSVKRTFGIDSDYVPPPRRPDATDPFSSTMQWSRRLIGLKLFMVFAELGVAGVVERIERQADLGDELRSLLEAKGFHLLNQTPLPVVCFTHPRIERSEVDPGAVVRQLADRQIAWISKTLLRGQTPALRACITNFDTDRDELVRLLEGLTVTIDEVAGWKAS